MAKILVIDDEKSIRETLKEILEYEDHQVDLAEDGETGIELLRIINTILFYWTLRCLRKMALKF